MDDEGRRQERLIWVADNISTTGGNCKRQVAVTLSLSVLCPFVSPGEWSSRLARLG